MESQSAGESSADPPGRRVTPTTVFPVNPHRASVPGIQAYPTLAALPQQVDLAVIATPALTVPGIIAECVEAGELDGWRRSNQRHDISATLSR